MSSEKRTRRIPSRGSTFLYQTSRERLNNIEVEAERRDLKPNKLLDQMVDRWLEGPCPHADGWDPKEEPIQPPPSGDVPWWLKK